MEGWTSRPLADVCDLFADGDWIETKDQSDTGIRLIQTGNVGEGHFKDRSEKARYVSEGTFTRLRCSEIFEGDCLISRLPDPVGRACVLPDTGERMITAVDCTIIRFKQSAVIPQFFVYYSQSSKYLADVAEQCTGATRSRISRKNLGEISIPVPPLPEQKHIVAILDEAFDGIDKAISNTEKNIANARELFDAVLDQNLSSGETQPHALGEVCELYQGLAINKGTKHLLVNHSSLPLLRIKDLRENAHEQFVAETGFPRNAEIRPEDIIYTRTGQIGLVFRGRRGVLHNNCFKVSPGPMLSKNFLFWWLQSPGFREKIARLASRAAQPDITHKLFKAQEIQIPPLSHQEVAAQTIELAHDGWCDIEGNLARKIALLRDLKQTLLAQAFSGKLGSSALMTEAAE